MKSQPTLSSNLRGSLSVVVVLLLFVLLFFASSVRAKKPVKPPPEPQVVSDSYARWGGNELTPGVLEADYRFCTLVEYAADMSSGTYSCELDSFVFYDFANFICEVAHTRGEDYRCTNEGSQYFIYPDLEYSFSWIGDCTSAEGCDITVVNRFTDTAVLGGPVTRIRLDPSLDRLTLEGFGHISGSSTANPFDESHSIVIDYMYITFIGTKGKGKVLAVCKATPLHEEYPVTFETLAVDSTE